MTSTITKQQKDYESDESRSNQNSSWKHEQRREGQGAPTKGDVDTNASRQKILFLQRINKNDLEKLKTDQFGYWLSI